MTYQEKLRDPRWQRKRLEIMQRDGFACRVCRNKDKELQVHHAIYARGKPPWETPIDHLFTLCKDHHEEIEILQDRLSLLMCTSGDVLDCLTNFSCLSECDGSASNLVALQMILEVFKQKPDELFKYFRKASEMYVEGSLV